jgi:hypothetical protein
MGARRRALRGVGRSSSRLHRLLLACQQSKAQHALNEEDCVSLHIEPYLSGSVARATLEGELREILDLVSNAVKDFLYRIYSIEGPRFVILSEAEGSAFLSYARLSEDRLKSAACELSRGCCPSLVARYGSRALFRANGPVHTSPGR